MPSLTSIITINIILTNKDTNEDAVIIVNAATYVL